MASILFFGGMELNKVTFDSWFAKEGNSGRDHLTVPLHIKQLPCGCTRGPKDAPFALRKNKNGIWIHPYAECKDPVVAAVLV